MELESGDIVLCTVDRIVGTTVFVHIEGDGEGSIVFSEIAPGRIRNIRDYVFPKKRIVCKVLRVSGDRVDLSLRRVTLKEQKEIKEKGKLEKSYESIIKSVLGDRAERALQEVQKKGKLLDFLQDAKEDPRELEKVTGKEEAEKILDIINSQQKKKISIVKREIVLKSQGPEGIADIKAALADTDSAEVRYLSAGRYSLKMEGKEMKESDQRLRDIVESIEKKAKKAGMDFSIIKK